MGMKRLIVAATIGTMAGSAFVTTASAEDSIYIPLFTYRTGAFAGSGIPIANGMHDYLDMLNARDGGIGGVKLIIEECETGYDTKKGVECYESIKDKKPVMTNPYSTGITLQIIPKASVDKIPVLSMAYGLSASANGTYFPWVFNAPATYWDGASVFVRYIAQREGGVEKLKGKKVGLVHLDAPYGKEPIPVLEALAKDYGFELVLYPVPAAEMQNQSSLWLNVRRDKPDWIFMQGFGAMDPTAVKEAAKIGYPMDHFIGGWWAGNEDDARPGGDGAKGYMSLSFTNTGTNFPVMQDILKYVVGKGKSQTPKEQVGENFYNRAVYNGILIAEGIRNAQKLTGKKVVTGEDVRRGLETINITEARLKEIGASGFAPVTRVTCDDHNGHNDVFVVQWDGAKWVKASDNIKPIVEKVIPLADAAAKDYAEKNAGWPKRTETCDKSS
jgi:branched-chain amino acid transport system substrate-binding protein